MLGMGSHIGCAIVLCVCFVSATTLATTTAAATTGKPAGTSPGAGAVSTSRTTGGITTAPTTRPGNPASSTSGAKTSTTASTTHTATAQGSTARAIIETVGTSTGAQNISTTGTTSGGTTIVTTRASTPANPTTTSGSNTSTTASSTTTKTVTTVSIWTTHPASPATSASNTSTTASTTIKPITTVYAWPTNTASPTTSGSSTTTKMVTTVPTWTTNPASPATNFSNSTKTTASTVTKPDSATDAMHLRFLEFKATYGKRYDTPAEEAKRFEVFSRNWNWLAAYKANVSRPYTLGMNSLMDLTDDEYAQLCGYRPDLQIKHDATVILSQTGPGRRKRSNLLEAQPGLYEVLTLPLIFGQMPSGPLPAAFDWREKGVVPPVQDQTLGGRVNCESCWAFAAMGVFNVMFNLLRQTRNVTYDLKNYEWGEQNLVDCVPAGCSGSSIWNAFAHMNQYGVVHSTNMPYTGKQGQCNLTRGNVEPVKKVFVNLKYASEDSLKRVVATVGPVAVNIRGNSPGVRFQTPASGLYRDDPDCSKPHDHAVVVVGYGNDEQSGKDFWLIRNSWGTGWGDNGYFKIERNRNNFCNITAELNYMINLEQSCQICPSLPGQPNTTIDRLKPTQPTPRIETTQPNTIQDRPNPTQPIPLVQATPPNQTPDRLNPTQPITRVESTQPNTILLNQPLKPTQPIPLVLLQPKNVQPIIILQPIPIVLPKNPQPTVKLPLPIFKSVAIIPRRRDF